jgi:RecA/RadA recombinase
MAKEKAEKKKTDYKKYDLVFDKYDITEKTEKDLKYWRTGVLSFDMVTEGKGLPEGLISIYSKSGNGKSTLAYSIVKNICSQGVPTIFASVEPSVKLRSDMGVVGFPVDILRVVDVLYYNEVQDIVVSFFYSPYKVLVIDSLTALSMGAETFEEKPLEDAPKIGADAGPQTRLCTYLSGQCKRTGKTVIYICQTRKDIAGAMHGGGGGDKQAGSEAVYFYADLTLKMYGSEKFTADDLFGIKENQIIASKGFLSADKNRHALPFVKIPYFCLFGKGISNKETLKIWMKWKEIYTVGGAGWYCVKYKGSESKMQGKSAFNKWITDNYNVLVADFYNDAPKFFKYFQDEKAYTNFMSADIDDSAKVEKAKQKALADLEIIKEDEEILKKELVKEDTPEIDSEIIKEAL